MFQSFEELDVWKRACALAVRVMEALKEWREFNFRSQMQRAALSIASNIAEGHERGGKDFARFLRIARGSSAELRTQAYIAAKAGLLDKEIMMEVVHETRGISRMLFALSRSLEPTPSAGERSLPIGALPKTEN